MSTAAFDVPTRGDAPAEPSAPASEARSAVDPTATSTAGPDAIDQTPARSDQPEPPPGRLVVVALMVRAAAIFFGLTGAGYGLARAWPDSDTDRLGSYPGWLVDLVPVDRQLAIDTGRTLELAAAGIVAGVVLAAIVAGLARWRPLARPLAAMSLVMASLSAPVIALIVYYWLFIRFDTGLRIGATSVFDDWGRSVDRLVAPAGVVGLVLAGPLAALMVRAPSPRRRADTGAEGRIDERVVDAGRLLPRAWVAVAAPLASRTSTTVGTGHRPGLVAGFPAGHLAAGLVTAEILFGRPGVFSRLVASVATGRAGDTLDALAVVAVGGAALALVVDVVGRSGRTDATGTVLARPTPRMVRLASVVLAVVAVIGLAGAALAPSPDAHPGNRLGDPFIDGVFGTDGQGRDLLAMAATGLGRALAAAAGPALVALVLAAVLAPLVRRFPRSAMVVPGAVVDGLWWPAAVVAMVAVPAVNRDWGLVDPVVLGLVGLALAPTGLRLWLRTVRRGRGLVPAALAVWLLLAPLALTANLVADFALATPGPDTGLGRQLGASVDTLASSPWPAVVPAVAVVALLVACHQLGAGLAALAWDRAEPVEGDNAPWELSMAADHDNDNQAWYEGTEPGSRPGIPDADADPDDGFDPDADDGFDPDDEYPDEVEDAGNGAPGSTVPEHGLLAPNYNLQPGLPPPELHNTMQIPVVRVKLADSEGNGNEGGDPGPPR